MYNYTTSTSKQLNDLDNKMKREVGQGLQSQGRQIIVTESTTSRLMKEFMTWTQGKRNETYFVLEMLKAQWTFTGTDSKMPMVDVNVDVRKP